MDSPTQYPAVDTSAAEGFLRELLGVSDLETLGLLAAREAYRRFSLGRVALLWWMPNAAIDGDAILRFVPAGALSANEVGELRQSLPANSPRQREGQTLDVEILVHTSGVPRICLVWLKGRAPGGTDWRRFIDDVGACAVRLTELAGLSRAVARLERAERVQRALFAIANMASSNLDMPDMLRSIHGVIGELMYAENFLIVLYESASDSLRFLYFADTEDSARPNTELAIPASAIPNSLTLGLIRSGRAQRGPSDIVRERLGILRDPSLGPDSVDWLGVPLLGSGGVRGAIVVQSYIEECRFNDEDQALLTYVAQHVLTALMRKQAREDLERRVTERTFELEQRNRELRLEVAERQRGERLQAALFSIAERSSTAETLEDFYAAVHVIVGELLNARNFYIALLSADGEELEFPYSVDELDPVRPRRRLSKGLTEYVLRTGNVLLADRVAIEDLAAMGEVSSFGPRSVYWLGVPLICGERTVGVLAVQSYAIDSPFTERDQELLTFVAYHIANGLERKLTQESLWQAYGELERRVHERTQELAIANQDLTAQMRERERIEETLKHQALHDMLTGLPNRSYLLDRLSRALERYQANPACGFAVLFLDLDRFKVVNDSVGHLVGDELLKQAAGRLAAAVRDPDTVARLGGDEFAILLEDLHNPERAMVVAERLIAALSEPMRIEGKELFTSASIGIAYSHARYTRSEELLRDADVAMYRAKAQGRKRVARFDEDLRAEALRVLDLEGDLRRALGRGEFEPYFQSIVRLRDGAIIGYEALLRWRHPQRGLLLPGDFLSVAEDNGSIEQIDWQMFAMACRDVHRLPMADAYVSINVSARQIKAPDFDHEALRLIEAHGVDPSRVRLEVTEGLLLENPNHVRKLLQRLREAGVLVQIDDFGTGYSSLSYLHRFPIHSLKIDRSFVCDLLPKGQGGSAAVVRAIRALANSLSLEVIGEGVETEVQRQALLDLGCTLGQGFLFSRPQSIDTLAASG